ncbi:unnamed protein product [Rhodiola kirilowii]
MKLLIWNCRGLGSSSAVRALQDVIRSYRPLVVGLVESKSDCRRCEIVRVKLGFDCCFAVPARGRSGGLVLFWNNISEVDVVSYSGFHIDFLLHYKGSVHITLFYGNPRTNLRHKSWDLLRRLRGLINLPWCVVGDFNEICNYSETSSRNPSRRSYMEQFKEALLDCGLMDLGYRGAKFTYTNKRQGNDEIESRLDRAVGDDLWLEKFPNVSVDHLASHHSDHCPLLLSMDVIPETRSKVFRFEAMWTRDTSLANTIDKSWNSRDRSDTMAVKLSHLSAQLKMWNKKSFGNVGKHLKRLKKELADVRLGPRTHGSIEKEKNIAKEIDDWLAREELMWAQRSRVSWLGEGDNNTRFFHLKANARKRYNTITSLTDSGGRVYSEKDDLENVAASYFRDIFTSTVNMPDADMLELIQLIPSKISDVHNRMLMNPFSENEIRRALFQLYPYKAPGLDGFPAGFFQKFWTTIREDFITSCLSILHDGCIPEGINDTLIVLIPKHKGAARMEDYRPISLTSVVSKTVAKAIVNRLQQILPEIISPAQSAFIKGRLITDNYLIAHEAAHFIKNSRQSKSVYGSLKLDMSKAYDRVEWRFMKLLLLRFGFEARWVSMILNYVTSVKFTICINGTLSGSIVPGRGLRQGDPLSPYLFILCSEWLSYGLSKLERERNFEGVKVCRRAPYINHLMFADDCLLLFKVKDGTAAALSMLLKQYENVSGQIINYTKSELVLSPNAPDYTRHMFCAHLSVCIVSHHAKYLGLPLSLQRKLTLNFSGLIDKFGNKTEGWMSKNLSAGGKEVLIKAVLQSLPQYAMNCFLLPDYIINKMHSSIRNFWWTCSSSKKPMHWINFQTMCRDKTTGGLGFKDFKCINMAFLAKQAWRVYTQPDLLISKIYKAKYCYDYDMLHCNVGYRPSFCWRSIVKGFELVRAGALQDQNGRLSWTANSSGILDISSAYKLMMQIKDRARGEITGCSNLAQTQKFWKDYWKMAVPRKVKIFGWRGFHAALPMGISLHRRGLIDNVGCGECGYKIETYSHAFLHCWFVRAIWNQLGFPELSALPDSVDFADIMHYCWSHFTHKKRHLILVTLWLIWYKRNKRKHGDSDYNLQEIVYKAKNLSITFEQYESKFSSSLRYLYSSDFDWRKPPAGYIKINCDASWKDLWGGGIGIVARDSSGNVLAVRALKGVNIHSSVACEGSGLLESFKLAEKLNADKVIFESDCADIVKWINICPDDKAAQEDWFKASLQMLHHHKEWKVFLIRREANVVADQLAKRVIDQNWCWTRLDCCPRLICFSSLF